MRRSGVASPEVHNGGKKERRGERKGKTEGSEAEPIRSHAASAASATYIATATNHRAAIAAAASATAATVRASA